MFCPPPADSICIDVTTIKEIFMQRRNILVVDLGFSSAKYLFDGKKGRIPSAFRANGSGFSYGEEAMIKSASSYLKTPAELIRHYPAFVNICRERAEVGDGSVPLAVGLPYSFWKNEDRPGGAVGVLRDSLSSCGDYSEVHVLPQGLGGIRSYLDTLAEMPKGNILAIDIGFNTVIFNLFSMSVGGIIYGDTMNKRGIHQLATEHVLPLIAHLAPARTFTPLEISILMERGEIQYAFEHFDIRQEVQQSAQKYIKAVLDDIVGDLEAGTGISADIKTILLFGGGAALLSDSLPVDIPFTILDEPEYANARGFASLAERL